PLLLLVGSGPECFRVCLGDLLLNQLSLTGLHREVGLRRCDLRLTRVTVHGDQVAGVPGEAVVLPGAADTFFEGPRKTPVASLASVDRCCLGSLDDLRDAFPSVVPQQRHQVPCRPELSPVIHLPDAVERATLRRARRSFHHLRHVSSFIFCLTIRQAHTGHDVLTEHRSQCSPGFASQFSALMPSFTEWKTSTTSCRLTVVRS